MDKRYSFVEDILEKFNTNSNLYKVVFYISLSTYFIIKRIEPTKFIVHYIERNIYKSSDIYNDSKKFLLTLNKYGRPIIRRCSILFFDAFMRHHPIYYNPHEYKDFEDWEFSLREITFPVNDPFFKDTIADASKIKKCNKRKK